MRKVFFTFFLFLLVTAYSQTDSSWSYGLEYSIQDVSVSDSEFGYIVTGPNIEGYAANFSDNNYSLGFVMNYTLNKKVAFSSGISYVNKDFMGTFICPVCDFIDLGPERIKQRFLSVPLIVQYQLSQGKFRPILEGGFQNNFNIQTDIAQANKAYYLEFLAGGSLAYDLSDKFTLGVGYQYLTAITHIYKRSDAKFRTHNFFIQFTYNP